MVPANATQASIEWVDNNGVMACWQESESRYDLQLEGIDAFGGNVIGIQFNGNVGRPHVAGTGNSNREGGVMRYSFNPIFRYYRATVRSVNTFCQPNESPRNGDWTSIEFQVHFTNTGKVFLDVNDDAVVDANGRCVSPSLNEADANTHVIVQRNSAPWNSYQALQGWGYVPISGNQNDLTDPSLGLGAPGGSRAMGGYPHSNMVDNNWSTPWISDSRSRYHNGELDDDVRGEGVNYVFTTPQEVQYIRFDGWSSGSNDFRVSDVPHLNVGAQTESGENIPLYGTSPHRSWFAPPGTLMKRISFTAHVTGWTDSRHMGVAEIQLFRNPVPVPRLTSTSGGEVIASGGWSNVGVYTLRSAAGVSTNLELDLNTDELTCSCPEGCQYTVGGSNQNMHYFVNVKADPWFQIRDGGVAAYGNGSMAISNPIPERCTSANNCTPTMVLTPNSSAPAVLTGGGTVDMSELPGVQTTGIDDENKNWLGRLTSSPARQDFAYFRRIYKFPTAEVQDDYELNFNNAPEPDGTPNNEGVTAYYREGDLTITSPWTVESGESHVILVNGDLNVNANITVAEGGFLAFVTSGDITFDSMLGSSTVTSTTPVVEGVYIADGKIILPPSQLKFVGAGTFVGWNGFDLFRNFESTDNWSSPTELFIYRPDLLRNAPEEMKTPRYEWNEVNP